MAKSKKKASKSKDKTSSKILKEKADAVANAEIFLEKEIKKINKMRNRDKYSLILMSIITILAIFGSIIAIIKEIYFQGLVFLLIASGSLLYIILKIKKG